MMVMYVPVKFEFDWTNHFRVRVRKKNVDGQMDGQKNGAKTNKRTEKRKKRTDGVTPISKRT